MTLKVWLIFQKLTTNAMDKTRKHLIIIATCITNYMPRLMSIKHNQMLIKLLPIDDLISVNSDKLYHIIVI